MFAQLSRCAGIALNATWVTSYNKFRGAALGAYLSLAHANVEHADHAGIDARLRSSRRLIWWPSIWWRPWFVLIGWREPCKSPSISSRQQYTIINIVH